MKTIELNPFQEQLLAVPEELDVFAGGGRGGGKSYALALLALRHCEQYGARARVLYVRKTYAGLRDFELVTRELFGTVYGQSARYNGSEHIWRMPNDGYLELGQLESYADYGKYQGRSFTLLLIDEAGQYATPELLDLKRSNLRGAIDLPIRVVVAGNPGGPGHFWIAKRYVFKTAPWKPFYEEKSKRTWVYAPSTYDDNQFIDREQYGNQLESACPTDPELLRAWKTGDWTVNRGAYFAACLEESRNAIEPWKERPKDNRWDTWLAHDFGSTAPSVTYLMAKSPGAEHEGKFYPRDSIILFDELAAVRPDSLTMGLGWTASTTAEAIKEMCNRWGIARPAGAADDACFANTGHGSGSIADEFARKGVYFYPAKKSDRISGWQLMKRLLADAGKPDVPGLYISRGCSYFWDTVPHLARDLKRVEDVESSGPDHAADACRYGLLRTNRRASVSPLQV